LLVRDNQFVHKGDFLYVIDQGDYDSIPDGNAGVRGDRNCAVARGRRALARLARSVPGRNRQPQQRTGFYFGDDSTA